MAAALSSSGASRQIFDRAARQNWALLISPWVLRETNQNLIGRDPETTVTWLSLAARAWIERDILTFPWPLVFQAAKDKPVLCTALAWADVLLTLDRRDFGNLLGQTVYGLAVLTPGDFLRSERLAGRLVGT
jgi:hypothetical protein